MWLIRASLGNPYMVGALVFIVIALGTVALINIPIDILPAFKTPAVQVLTFFRGMPASGMEKTITGRIERWVNQAPGVSAVESKTVAGISVVKLFFRGDTDPNAALTVTNSLALGTMRYLPPNTLPPVVLPFDPTGTLPLGLLTVSNPSMDEAKVKDVARIDVRNLLGAVRGSVAPVVVGGKDRTILVYLDPKALEARKLSPVDVVKALEDGNLMVSPGAAYFGDSLMLLDTNAMVRTVEELNDLPIRLTPGQNVSLSDIGRAEDAASVQTSRVRINGKPQVYVPIYRQGGASSLAVAEETKSQIKAIENRLPAGTSLEFVMDQTVTVKQSIEALLHEGALGIILVGGMIFLFLGSVRMTFIAAASIPLSLMGAVIGLYASGNTINAMTLSGLALAVGPLVDNAIVALENAHRHAHALGKSRMQAALDGTSEVFVPVLVATCTTSIVLAPLALMPGMGGFLFKPLALAVGYAMLASLLLTWTFVAMMCGVFLKEESHQTTDQEASRGFLARIEMALDALTAGYRSLLLSALRFRWLVLVGVLALFLGTLTIVPHLGQEFFPQVDSGQLTLLVRAPSHLRLDATERRVAELEAFIAKHIPSNERQMILSELGINADWSAAYTPNSGQQDAAIRVQLTPQRSRSAQQYAVLLRHKIAMEPQFADLDVAFDTGGMVSAALNFGQSSPIDIRLEGGTPEEALTAARKIQSAVRRIRGAADVRIQQRLDAPYLVVDVDRQLAAQAGLSARDVVLQVVAAMNSSVSISRNFWIDQKSGNQYFVGVQYPDNPDLRIDALEHVFATGTNQKQPVKLASLVKLTNTSDAVEISHADLYRTFNVLVNTENRDIAGVASEIEEVLAGIELPKGIRYELFGEYLRMQESTRNLVQGLAMAAILVYLLLVALFRSWVGPFIIMFTLPLGLIGVILTLWLTNTTLNIQSEMGVIFLVGIAVNNGVLLVDFANRQRQQVSSAHEAIVLAASTRFKPILMTFLATFLDLLPMAIGGRGAEATMPLARAVVGGLLTSTVLTLFVVPCLYTLLMRAPPAATEEPHSSAEQSENPGYQGN